MLILEAQERAAAQLESLLARLQKALHLAESELAAWRTALAALLSQAAQQFWPAEARLLYDLQKICIDRERPLYRPDLVEWAYSGFHQPLLRPLPNQALVLAVKHLRVAIGRLASVRVTDVQRQSLNKLLHDALHHGEERLRDCYRRPLADALARVGLEPHNLPERLGRDKLIEEMLDRITERGFLNMSDLRDALARNQLKLEDLASTRAFFQGDPLIRANRELAQDASEVYRRGEFYLRWLQRGSSLLFGTPAGRWLTLFILLPFLGAFATVVGVEEILHLVGFHSQAHIDRLEKELAAAEFDEDEAPVVQHKGKAIVRSPASVVAIIALALFYLPLVHLPKFRQFVWRCALLAWRAIRAVLIDIPVTLFQVSGMRWFVQSRPFLLFIRYGLKPLPVALVAWALLAFNGEGPIRSAGGAGLAFVVAALIINSRLGRDFEEVAIDRTVRNVEFVRGLVPGLFLLVMNFFRAILEGMDRFFYAVDEWLRFRGGEGRIALVFKTMVGFVWFLISYVIRLYVNVFIEPTFNPIKHFPVVTVAAKILVPFWPVLIPLFGGPFEFLGRWTAFFMANVVLHSLPGAAGFLVWEFKENWRLYRANRPATLCPEIVGHHGETMLRLMKPGFHSGTLPKLYAKLRSAERRARRHGTWKAARRLREKLHEVEESIRHFTERELIAFLAAGKDWSHGLIELVRVRAGSNRIHLELACAGASGAADAGNLELHFEELSGWLLTSIARPGWLPQSGAGTAGHVYHCPAGISAQGRSTHRARTIRGQLWNRVSALRCGLDGFDRLGRARP